MKIAQVAPLSESVPPKLYGGTERVVSYLTDELVDLGHDVTLFAAGDSMTRAELVPCCKRALRLDQAVRDQLPHHLLMLEEVARRAAAFDVIHFHIDLLQMPVMRAFGERALTTVHGRLDIPDLVPFYRVFSQARLVSISDAQRRPLRFANFVRTIHHGLPENLLPFVPVPSGGYLAFLGRISPEKRPDRAIEIATRAGLPLKIAAKVDRVDEDYWRERIAPMVAMNPNVEYVGEIGEHEKAAFLGNACALLVPIDWPEPFGLVMIEAMSCGTPVIAFRRGSVPEVIEEGRSGFMVENVAEAVRACARLGSIDRAGVRAAFEERFTARRMACDHVEVYGGLSGVVPTPAHLRDSGLPPLSQRPL